MAGDSIFVTMTLDTESPNFDQKFESEFCELHSNSDFSGLPESLVFDVARHDCRVSFTVVNLIKEEF